MDLSMLRTFFEEPSVLLDFFAPPREDLLASANAWFQTGTPEREAE